MNSEQILELPYLNGVYIAVDALRGCYLIVDGPYCVFTKAEMQYCHNLRCTLLPHRGHARVVHTAAESKREEVAGAALDRTQLVEKVFEQVCAQQDAQVILAVSFDFHQLLNFPLQAMAARFGERTGKQVWSLPERSLGGSWLDGYGLACETLARFLPLRAGQGRADRVAIVGYLFDRDEPDHHGNLQELRRLLSLIGLEVSSVWLSGGTCQELLAAEQAGWVLSFPHARGAANLVASRLGIPRIDVDLPLGLSATARWLQTIANQVGRASEGEAVVRTEVAAAIKDTRAHVLRIVRGNLARVQSTDPCLKAALEDFCQDVGLRVTPAEVSSEILELRCHELLFSPTLCDTDPKTIHIPIGYPNYVEHPVGLSPTLGFAGFRGMVDRISSAILRFEASTRQRTALERAASARNPPDA